MHYVFITVLAITTSSLTFAVTPQEAENLQGTNVKEVVRSRAANIMNLQQSRQIALHLGRKSLILEMQNQPNQLSLDIVRFPQISIGDQPISAAVMANKSPEQMFLLIAGNLEKYLKERLPSVKNAGIKGRLGEFWTSEIIYAMVQTFLAPSIAGAYKEVKALEKGEWGSQSGTTKLSASFKILAPSILQLTLKSEKSMLNMSNNKLVKPLVVETKINFDLALGEVTFNYSYNFDGATKSWSMQSFFMAK